MINSFMGANDQLEDEDATPIPRNTKVLLDHIAIDKTNKQIAIYCTILDDVDLVQNMYSLKGYTVIAYKGFLGSSFGREWRWGGSGKIAELLDREVGYQVDVCV